MFLIVSFPLFFCDRRMDDIRKLFGKPSGLEKVNLAEKLDELGLSKWFGSASWPEAAAVRELKTKAENKSGEGFTNPFIFADLHK